MLVSILFPVLFLRRVPARATTISGREVSIMKITVVGVGQCGSRIADEFARLGLKARRHKGIQIITDVLAVNTDAGDLTGLTCIKSDWQHRILIGGRKTNGHGVGKINELAAEIAKEDADKVIESVRGAKRFYESDAFLLVASTGGGTGSGSIPVISSVLKQRYVDKPMYVMLVLPFEHEEQTEHRTVYNSAMCLKSVSSVADAVILVDNQRYIKKDASLKNNMARINQLIVEPFYDILSAGEEKKKKNIGARLLDAGDIAQTIAGWTILGFGKVDLPLITLPFKRKRDFREKGVETSKGVQAMDQAISELSLQCNPHDAGRALYLLAGPEKEMNMDLVKELGDYLKNIAPEAVIRYGDYPRKEGNLTVSVILSELKTIDKVKYFYDRFPEVMEIKEKREKAITAGKNQLETASISIPSLVE
jgi:cell division GTPase FtsZ